MFGVLIVLGIEGHEIAGTQLELAEQLLIGVGIVTDDIDLLDRRNLALGNSDGDAYPVPGLVSDAGFDVDAVFPSAVVLPAQFLLYLVEHGTIKDLAFDKTDAF